MSDRTSFLGRQRELAEAESLVLSRMPLVTVHGPPGIGKSRLAARVASVVMDEDRFPGGVWRCDLSGARTDADVVAIVSRVTGATAAASSARIPVELVGRDLARRGRTLLVLDNVERVVDSVRSLVQRWLELATELQLIVTTRERLDLGTETCRDLPPLSQDEGVALFQQRAAAHRALDIDDAAMVVLRDLVEHLDGNPLAIELAASRVVALSLVEIRDRLSERFRLLTTRRRDVPKRHASLRGAIDSSWEVLPPWGREALCQCTVFRGGFTLSQAEAVIRVDPSDNPPPVADIVEELLARSLLQSWRPSRNAAGVRLDCSRSIRDYVAEVSDAFGANRDAAVRHAEFFVDYAEKLASAYESQAGADALEKLFEDMDNVLAVCERFGESSAELAARAALSLFDLVRVRRLYATHVQLFDDAVTWTVALGDEKREAQARWARAALLLNAGSPDSADTELARVAQLASALGDGELEAKAHLGRGAIVFADPTRWRDASTHWTTAADRFAKAGKMTSCANALANLALVALDTGDIDAAAQHCADAIAMVRKAGATHRLSFPLMVSAAVAEERGEPDVARERYDEAIEIARDIHHHVGHQAEAMTHRGILECGVGQWDVADALLAEAHGLYAETGADAPSGITGAFYAVTRAHMGDAKLAEQLLADSGPLLDELSARGSERLRDITRELVALALGGAIVPAVADAATSGPAQPVPQVVRAAERILMRQREVATRSERLRIGPAGRWFERGGQPRVDLQRRMLLRRLLLRLGTQRVEHPRQPIGNAQLIAECWPGETIQRDAASNRLYVALSKLRGLGLAGLIVKDADGYMLTIDVTVELVKGPDASAQAPTH